MARTLSNNYFYVNMSCDDYRGNDAESKNSGFGALSGQVDSDSYVRKNRGRTKEGKLERITAILGFLFFVVAIGLCLKVFQ